METLPKMTSSWNFGLWRAVVTRNHQIPHESDLVFEMIDEYLRLEKKKKNNFVRFHDT